ncbi:M48 family metallopeptidase [uncultured Campylobacter sp.]|uniref:M48 family metallopeptidase n=1 Tax=uncultured Campylobacter sp. TaxID=218934 RepID=UPI002624F328|nr:M48 family metallopeptidase [uncultured Campylobacter sp.]
MAEQKVSLNLLGLPISLRFKRMKYARIRINKDCEISVSVPRSYTAAQAKDFILKHESWIRQTLERLRSKLLASDQVRILGKIYKLKFSREVELGTNCGADESLGESGARDCVNWANGDAGDDAGGVNSAHLQSSAGISGSGGDGDDVSGSANNAMGDMGDGACGGTGSEILKFHSGERTSQSSAAGENLKFDLPGNAAQGLAQQSEMRQGGGFINIAVQNGAADADLKFNLAREDASLEGGENLKFNPNALGARGQNLNRDGAQNLAGEEFFKSSRIQTEALEQNGGEQSCSENLKFHLGGRVPQSNDASKFNSASSGEILKFDPAAKGEILKFKPIAGDGISNFKPAVSGEISNFSSVVGEGIPLMSERISKSASKNVPQNVAQSAQAADIERDEPDFTIKNFIQSSKFKDKIFVSGGAIFCESEGEFAAFKKAFALELYLRYIEKFSPRIGRKIARVRVRTMQTRWGSCNHAKGYLNFSLSLIERDPRFVEYVVLHELAHLIHANHGADFYALIAQIMPDFRERIKLGKG